MSDYVKIKSLSESLKETAEALSLIKQQGRDEEFNKVRASIYKAALEISQLVEKEVQTEKQG